MNIKYTHELPMGHRLQKHEGKCRWLHGHNYLIDVYVDGDLDSQGMVLDYHDLKKAVKFVLEPFDHGMVLEHTDLAASLISNAEVSYAKVLLIDCPPTAENLALLWRQLIEDELMRLRPVRVDVTVHETANTSATASGGMNDDRTPSLLDS